MMRAVFVLAPAVLVAAVPMLIDPSIGFFVFISVAGFGMAMTKTRPERDESNRF